MYLTTQTFWLPKPGSQEDEYEDAWAVDEARGRAAVADGASESAFAREWATLLAQAFVADPPADVRPQSVVAWLRPPRQALVEALAPHLPTLSYYAAERARQGMYATWLGLQVDYAAGTWRAWAVGDCGLFHWRAGRYLLRWPLNSPDAFGNRPDLLCSRPDWDDALRRSLRVAAGKCAVGDLFLLSTDALAAWLVGPGQDFDPRNGATWTLPEWRDWVQDRQARREMRADDVTGVWLWIREDPQDALADADGVP